MSVPEFEFRYQTTPSTRSVKVANIAISREPLVVDFSSTYPNNQESIISTDSYPVVGNAVNISGVVGNFVITDKIHPNGTFLFYEYQPQFDIVTSGINLMNESGEQVPYKIEYGYIDPTNGDPNIETPLSDFNAIDYDILNGHSEIGIPNTAITFAPFPIPSGDLGYTTHADSLAVGSLKFSEFNDAPLPSSGNIDFTFLSELDSVYQTSIYADDWSIDIGSGLINLNVNGAPSATLGIDSDTWYFGRLTYNEYLTRLAIYRDSLIGTREISDFIVPSGFDITCENLFVNHIVLSAPESDVNWNIPPIVPRYHHALRWNDIPIIPGSSHYRTRILTELNDPMTMIYDAYKPDGTIEQNRIEVLNHVPIYKESVTQSNDWSLTGTTLIPSGPLADASIVYIKPLYAGFISVDIVEENIVVTNGSFNSSPFDTSTGKYIYELLEYEALMPFETDNQNIVIPRSLKESKYRATVLEAYKIKVLPLVVDEGRYPYYIPASTEDLTKIVSGDTVVSVTGSITDVTYRETRGIRVYINGSQIGQELIRGFDADRGIITLNTAIRPDDNVEVTFLRRVPHFICNYPRIKPGITDGSSWRIYIRSNYPNYFLVNPVDTLERLAYRKLENGEPIGNLRSCRSNELVSEPEGTIKLADISLVPVITFTDDREFGGGLLPDDHFSGSSLRKNSYPSSIFYSNIANFQSTAPANFSTYLPWPCVIIRIPSSVRTVVEARFMTQSLALEYIKKGIEKHLALGVYYIIIDENNQLWDNPYPSIGPKTIRGVNLEQ